MMNTGMRTQEVLGLKWEYVDLDKGIIQVRRAITLELTYDDNGNKLDRKTVLSTTKKGTGDRDMRISEAIVNALKKRKKEAPEISKTGVKDDDYVLGNTKNGSWTYSGLRITINRYIKRNSNDLNGVCLHRVRHTVATMLAENGATGIEIMKCMGHKKHETSMKYINEVSTKIAEANKELIEKCLGEMLTLM